MLTSCRNVKLHGPFFAGKKSSVSFIAYLHARRIAELEAALKSGLHISRKDRKHMVASVFIKFFMHVLVFT